MFYLFRKRISDVIGLFQGHYADARLYYTFCFNEMPVVSFIGELDGSKAFQYISEQYRQDIAGIYQHNYFDHEKKDIFFNSTLFVLKDKRMIEIAGNYCHVLYSNKQYNWGNELTRELAKFRTEAASANDKVIGFARSNNMN